MKKLLEDLLYFCLSTIRRKFFIKVGNKISVWIREYYYSIFADVQLLKEMEKLRNLTIETVNICNSNCNFCAYQYLRRKKRIISDEIFKKAIHDFTSIGGGNLSLTTIVGDPLLDPKFVERVQYARSFPSIKKITTITNCLNLHNVGATNLLNSGLNEIGVSMTGFDTEMYKRIFRSRVTFEQMKSNILELLRANNELGRPVRISIGLRIDKPLDEVLNYPGFDEVIQLADLVDANYYFDDWGGRIKSEDLTGNMKIRPKIFHFMRKKTPCSMMYSGAGVLVDGTVTVCPCRDLDGDSDLVIGNLNALNLSAIYYSKRLEDLRNAWLHGKYIPDICRDCTHYNPYTYMMLSEVKKQFQWEQKNQR